MYLRDELQFEDDDGEDRAEDGDDVRLDRDRDADGGDGPDGGRGGDALHRQPFTEHEAGAEETDAGHDLRGDAAVVAGEEPAGIGEEGGAHADEGHRADAGGIAAELAFEAHEGAEDGGQRQPPDDLPLQARVDHTSAAGPSPRHWMAEENENPPSDQGRRASSAVPPWLSFPGRTTSDAVTGVPRRRLGLHRWKDSPPVLAGEFGACRCRLAPPPALCRVAPTAPVHRLALYWAHYR